MTTHKLGVSDDAESHTEIKKSKLSCSLCDEVFSRPMDLGTHILVTHCGGNNELSSNSPPASPERLVIVTNDNVEERVEAPPPFESTIEEEEALVVDSNKSVSQCAPPLSLPRPPTTEENNQKFMVLTLPDARNRYICLICTKSYLSRYNIRMHANMHTGTNIHTCPYCGRYFARSHVFQSHLRSHTGERPFACIHCGRAFADPSNCNAHRKKCRLAGTGKPNGGEKTLSTVCSNNNNSVITTQSTTATPVSTSETITCDWSPQIVSVQTISDYDDTNICENHEQEDASLKEESRYEEEEIQIEPDIHHYQSREVENLNDQSNVVVKMDKKIEPIKSSLEANDFTCSFCNVKINQQKSLIEHITTHISLPRLPDQADYERGYAVFYYSTRPKSMCLSCGKIFTTEERVKTHLNMHIGDNVYNCRFCDKVFLEFSVFEVHIKTHSEEFKYGCKFCSHSFMSNSSMLQHQKRCDFNTDAKPRSLKESEMKPSWMINNPTENASTESPQVQDKTPLVIRPPPLTSLTTTALPPLQLRPVPLKSLLTIERKKEKVLPSPPLSTACILTSELSKNNNLDSAFVESRQGDNYVPDKNSNNVIVLDSIKPPPTNEEKLAGFCHRPFKDGQFRYICTRCGKHYTTNYNMRQHIHIHTGRGLYTCRYCHHDFTHKHVWETHERIHTGERPFVCPTCPKDFADRSNYNSHRKMCPNLLKKQSS